LVWPKFAGSHQDTSTTGRLGATNVRFQIISDHDGGFGWNSHTLTCQKKELASRLADQHGLSLGRVLQRRYDRPDIQAETIGPAKISVPG
jgi:hypothetical protein